MEIEPTYVTFGQAKWLKEKGFKSNTHMGYSYFQHLREYKLISHRENKDYAAPEQWQVVEWLRVKHSIFVFPEWQFSRKKWLFNITKLDSHEETIRIQNNYYKALGEQEYDSPQESYSAAFDYVLNNNLI